MLDEIFQDFLRWRNKPVKGQQPKKDPEHKISPTQIKALFLMLDVDESGELEEQEVMDVL